MHVDTESMQRAANTNRQAALEAKAAADCMESVGQRLERLLGHGYGNAAERLAVQFDDGGVASRLLEALEKLEASMAARAQTTPEQTLAAQALDRVRQHVDVGIIAGESPLDTAKRIITAINDSDQLLKKMWDLLARTANALKGEPKPLHQHGWSDLPKLAAEAVAAKEPGWVYLDEGMPDEDLPVLVTYRGQGFGGFRDGSLYVIPASFFFDGWRTPEEVLGHIPKDSVIAWKPLPAPAAPPTPKTLVTSHPPVGPGDA